MRWLIIWWKADSRVMVPGWSAVAPAFLQGFFAGGGGEVILEGNRLTLKGDRPASKGRSHLATLLDPIRKAGCEVTDLIRLVPDLEPVLKTRLADGVIKLEGRVASEAVRDRLLEAANASGASDVENKLEVNPAVKPEAWLESAPGVLRGLFADGQTGELAFEGTRWRVPRRAAEHGSTADVDCGGNQAASQGGDPDRPNNRERSGSTCPTASAHCPHSAYETGCGSEVAVLAARSISPQRTPSPGKFAG